MNTATLRAQVRRLQRTPWGTPRLVIVVPSLDPADEPGTIRPLPSKCGLWMVVPYDQAADPLAGLSDAQRAQIRADDQIIAVAYDDVSEAQPET